jgi:hypothetical protein
MVALAVAVLAGLGAGAYLAGSSPAESPETRQEREAWEAIKRAPTRQRSSAS